MKSKIVLTLTAAIFLFGCTSKDTNITISKSLEAGVAVGTLEAPIGITQGGFGERSTCNSKEGICFKDERFSQMLFSSLGMFDRPAMRALALDNGASQMIIVQIPIIFSYDLMRQLIIDRVAEISSYKIGDSFIMTASHSHSGPVRYPVGIPDEFGFGGVDSSQIPILNSYVEQISDLIIDSINAKQPAKIGTKIAVDWDLEDEIYYDRRCEDENLYDDPYLAVKDPHLGLIRVETEDGEPLAAVINFALHGTILGGNVFMLSGDGPESVARNFEDYHYSQTGKPITALFVNGSAGDIGPTSLGDNVYQRVDSVGKRAAPKIYELFSTIDQLNDKPEMEVASMRLPLNYDDIYPEDPYDFNFPRGGFFCNTTVPDSQHDCGNPETTIGRISCILDMEKFETTSYEMELELFEQALLSVARIDEMFISMMPGEPNSSLTAYMRLQIAEKFGLSTDQITVFGYSQDHHFYLMLPEDWMQGGYESSMNAWGPEGGKYLVDAAVELMGQLTTTKKENNDNGLIAKQADYDMHPEDREWPFFDVGSDSIGPIELDDFPAIVSRTTIVTLKWQGGDNACGTPTVTLEKYEGAGFVPAVGSNGRVLDEKGFESAIFFDFPAEFEKYIDIVKNWRNQWRFELQIPPDLETGKYQLTVAGQYYDGEACTDHPPFSSPEFEVALGDQLTVLDLAVDRSSGRISAKLKNLPAGGMLYFTEITDGSITATVTGSSTETVELSYDEEAGEYAGSYSFDTEVAYTVSVVAGDAADLDLNKNGQDYSVAVPIP